MKMIWTCAWLRMKWWLRRPVELSFLVLIVPIAVVLLLLLTGNSAQEEGIRVAVVDEDQSIYSEVVIDRFSTQSIVSVEKMNREEAIQLVQTNKIEAAIIFSNGFMDQLIDKKRAEIVELYYPPSSLTHVLISELVASEVLRLSSNVQAAHYIDDKYEKLDLLSREDKKMIEQNRVPTNLWEDAWNQSDSYWEPEPLMSITYIDGGLHSRIGETETSDESESQAWIYFEIQFLMGCLSALILFLFIFMQQWIVDDYQLGVRKRLKGTAVSPLLYIIGHSIPTMVFVLLQGILALVLIFGMNQFALPLTWEIVFLFVLYVMATFSIGTYIAILVKSPLQLQTVGVLFVLFTSLAGGSFVDLSEWSDSVKWLSYGTPQGWFLNGVRDILPYVGEGSVGSAVLLTGCALCVFTLFFTALSVERWRKQS